MGVVVESNGLKLEGSVYRPAHSGPQLPGVVICHGYPSVGAAQATAGLGELGERIANELGWVATVIASRGCGASEGDFSLGGWLEDVEAVATWLRDQPDARGVWMVGFGTGGALAVCAAARLPWVRGVATLGTPADFDDWAGHPRRLLQHARSLGLIRSETYPVSMDAFSRPLREIQAVACARSHGPRPLLVVHGSDDDLVPSFDARVIVDAHGAAELRIIQGAGHQLRYDPRAMAILLGWLDRQRRAELV